jgi:sortase A
VAHWPHRVSYKVGPCREWGFMWSFGRWREERLACSIRGELRHRNRWDAWMWIERALLSSGLGILAIVGVTRVESILSSRAALKSFADLDSSSLSSPQRAGLDSELPGNRPSVSPGDAVKARIENVPKGSRGPIAVLRVPKIHLEVPVFNGADALTLNHAVGRIVGTGRPGGSGNIGLAGHRDTFFRGLKDLQKGDVMELKTEKRTDSYIVDEIQIVTPDNVGVLRPRRLPSLTLVTCYPFSYIGSAPQRYVVMASLTEK